MMRRVVRHAILVAIAAAIGVGAAHAEVAWRCRGSVAGEPSTEACTWGKAYLPFTRVAYALLLGGAAWAVMAIGVRRGSRG